MPSDKDAGQVGNCTVHIPVSGASEITLQGGRVHCRFSVRSEVGRVRKIQEDSVMAQSPVFLVADGMGGHAHGDVASQTVVRVFDEHIERDMPSTPERILDAIHSSNDAVHDLSSVGDYGASVSGTTLAGVAFVNAGDDVGYHWMGFNVGDSPIYTWQDGELTQLSVDHSAVQEMFDAGLITFEEAEKHPERNVITRAIGADEFVDADVWLLPASGRQAFLVCSDGLTKELDHRDIAQVLATHVPSEADPRTLADVLVEEALERGGRDNVSVVVLEAHYEV